MDHNPTAVEEAAIRELIERWSKAVRDENLAGIRADHDPDILMFDVPPPLQIHGLDAYMATWEGFLGWSVKPAMFDLHDVNVVAGKDVAFATAIGRCSGKDKRDQVIQLEFRLTIGLRKRDGQWSIVHEPHSVPATD